MLEWNLAWNSLHPLGTNPGFPTEIWEIAKWYWASFTLHLFLSCFLLQLKTPKSRDCGWSGDLFKEPCGKESRTTVFTFIRMVLSLSECTYPSEPRLLYLCLLFSSKHSQLYYFWNLQSADFPPKFSFSTLSIQLLFSILLCFLYCIIG